MWQLVDVATGKVARRNLCDQWDACKNAFHKNGSKYKKAEAMALKSGDIVYCSFKVKKFIKLPVIKDGRIVDETTRTTMLRELKACRLERLSR